MITWWALSQMPVVNTRQPNSPPRPKLESLGSSSALRPLGALPWCSFSRRVTQVGPNVRQRSWVWDGRDKELKKVKEDGKCLRRKGEQGCGEERSRVCEVNNEGKKQERDQWRGCISRMFQANYSAPSPPFPSIFCSYFSLTCSISAITIHMLSTAIDP